MFKIIRELPIEFPSSYDYFLIVALSYVAFMTIYLLISPWLSKFISVKYNQLPFNYKIEWNAR